MKLTRPQAETLFELRQDHYDIGFTLSEVFTEDNNANIGHRQSLRGLIAKGFVVKTNNWSGPAGKPLEPVYRFDEAKFAEWHKTEGWKIYEELFDR